MGDHWHGLPVMISILNGSGGQNLIGYHCKDVDSMVTVQSIYIGGYAPHGRGSPSFSEHVLYPLKHTAAFFAAFRWIYLTSLSAPAKILLSVIGPKVGIQWVCT